MIHNATVGTALTTRGVDEWQQKGRDREREREKKERKREREKQRERLARHLLPTTPSPRSMNGFYFKIISLEEALPGT